MTAIFPAAPLPLQFLPSCSPLFRLGGKVSKSANPFSLPTTSHFLGPPCMKPLLSPLSFPLSPLPFPVALVDLKATAGSKRQKTRFL